MGRYNTFSKKSANRSEHVQAASKPFEQIPRSALGTPDSLANVVFFAAPLLWPGMQLLESQHSKFMGKDLPGPGCVQTMHSSPKKCVGTTSTSKPSRKSTLLPLKHLPCQFQTAPCLSRVSRTLMADWNWGQAPSSRQPQKKKQTSRLPESTNPQESSWNPVTSTEGQAQR